MKPDLGRTIELIAQKKLEAFAETHIDGELVLACLDTGIFYALKGTGLAIWRLIDETPDVNALKAQLAKAYHSSTEICGPDIDSFLRTLEESQLITITNEP